MPEIDFEGQSQLFSGNIHPPEYYRRFLEGVNETEFKSQDYSKGITILLDALERD
jgi:hypothetical protein